MQLHIVYGYSQHNGRVEWLWERLFGLQSLKYLLSGPSQEKNLPYRLEPGRVKNRSCPLIHWWPMGTSSNTKLKIWTATWSAKLRMILRSTLDSKSTVLNDQCLLFRGRRNRIVTLKNNLKTSAVEYFIING